MSVEEVKARIAKMNQRQRREIQLYLIQLRSETPAWRKETTKRNRELAAGKGLPFSELKKQLRA
jgi:hypothetical protein